jgi:sec-independent protein translocase protein TatC
MAKAGGLLKQLRSGEKEMPFLSHLEELRGVVLRAVAGFLLATIGCYILSGRVLEALVLHTIQDATFLRPMEAFNARLKVAFLMGLIVSLPWVLLQIWGFVVPGLMKKERKTIGPMVLWSTLLFYAGIAFSYFVLTPLMLRLLVGFQTEHIRPQIAVGGLLDFVVTMALASGVLFQLPLVVAALSMIGILTPAFLIKRWRHAVVGIFILTAVITPGDGPSQIVLGIPVLILYFASILVARAIWRGKKKGEDGGGKAGEENQSGATEAQEEKIDHE